MSTSIKPLAIDLFCGLGGWTDGLLAEGWRVVGFDIKRHDYGTGGYPAQIVLQDVLTLHGKQFKDAALIVASPPCQEYSYMAMPWSRAKTIAAEYRAGVRDVKQLTALFDACFRIQREAIEAAGHHIPMVVENVRGAIPWVGRSRWNYGSFHLWGDVPALMPMTKAVLKSNPDGTDHPPGSWFAIADSKNRGANSGQKVPGFRFDGSGGSFQTASVEGTKTPGRSLDRNAGKKFGTHNMGSAAEIYAELGMSDGVKQGGDWFNAEQPSISRMCGSKSKARKAASAAIAKIPLPLAQHIAAYWKPRELTA